jgi:hypothetical protein
VSTTAAVIASLLAAERVFADEVHLGREPQFLAERAS